MEDLLDWYKRDNGMIAIFDGTNSTYARRQMILSRLKAESARGDIEVKAIFIEILCEDEESTSGPPKEHHSNHQR